eukprot:768350-Hanusia_phi.AAC.2
MMIVGKVHDGDGDDDNHDDDDDYQHDDYDSNRGGGSGVTYFYILLLDVAVRDSEQYASSDGRMDTVKTLLSLGTGQVCTGQMIVQPLVSECSRCGRAAGNGHAEVALLLLHHGADVNASDVQNYTALHEAAWCGHVDVVKCWKGGEEEGDDGGGDDGGERDNDVEIDDDDDDGGGNEDGDGGKRHARQTR